MEVCRSGFYEYKNKTRLRKGKTDISLKIKLKEIAEKSKYSYGSRRISKSLKFHGFNIGRYRARTLMKEAHVECKQRRKYKVTTQSNHKLPLAANRLNRQFKIDSPNCAWVTDITYLWTKEGWVYLAAVLDLFSRKVVGWAMAPYMTKKLTTNALEMAIGRRNPKSGLMHHSDRGCQYTSHEYQGLLKKLGIVISMSRKGNCWDNAVMERFFGSLKSERTDNKIYQTRDQARADVVDYIEMFYNSERLHSTLGYMSPIEFEKIKQVPFS